jgi:enamine deaminase RidA (YjgF/YER057c/UK114 family)
MNMSTSQGDSYQQPQTLLENYETLLAQHNATIQDHCIRTWFFVRDVDTQYHGLVAARRNNFNQHGLTAQTHYIASTGIGGNPSNTKALIQLGCYTLKGFQPQQQQYLYAHTHLNRTSDYGVTFERGTLLQFGDRNHAYISGTASINNKGEVVHIGNIEKQTQRMWENVETLLQEANMTMADTAQIIVYLRDNADYNTVSQMFRQKYPHVPTVFTLAPVCRPTWLIEMECIAIRTATNNTFNNF